MNLVGCGFFAFLVHHVLTEVQASKFILAFTHYFTEWKRVYVEEKVYPRKFPNNFVVDAGEEIILQVQCKLFLEDIVAEI